MAKRSGYQVTATFFLAADPNNAESMRDAFEYIAKIKTVLSSDGYFDGLTAPDESEVKHRFVQRRELPDEPKAAQVGHTIVVPIELTPEPTLTYEPATPMPPIPASLKR